MNMPLDAMSETSDEALLILYANGDQAAAAALTLRLTPRAYSLASRMLNDRTEAEDVTQEALLRLWKLAPDWRRGEAQPATWLYRVVHNLCLDRLRRRRSVALESVAEPVDETPSAESRLQTGARARALRAALAELPERQRVAVLLRHFEGLANPEIGKVLDISTEAVESLIARGKRRLGQVLAAKRGELGLDQ